MRIYKTYESFVSNILEQEETIQKLNDRQQQAERQKVSSQQGKLAVKLAKSIGDEESVEKLTQSISNNSYAEAEQYLLQYQIDAETVKKASISDEDSPDRKQAEQKIKDVIQNATEQRKEQEMEEKTKQTLNVLSSDQEDGDG